MYTKVHCLAMLPGETNHVSFILVATHPSPTFPWDLSRDVHIVGAQSIDTDLICFTEICHFR